MKNYALGQFWTGVAGVIAVSDFKTRAIMINEDICVSIFGSLKGKIMIHSLKKLLSTPFVDEQNKGYIDFIATAPEFKRCGVASKLLEHIENNTDFKWLYLDVLKSNKGAICLYEKSGYITETVKNNFFMRFAGIEAMNIMKKELI